MALPPLLRSRSVHPLIANKEKSLSVSHTISLAFCIAIVCSLAIACFGEDTKPGSSLESSIPCFLCELSASTREETENPEGGEQSFGLKMLSFEVEGAKLNWG